MQEQKFLFYFPLLSGILHQQGTTWETINKYCLHGAQQLPGISCYIFLVPNIFSRVDLILIRVLSL